MNKQFSNKGTLIPHLKDKKKSIQDSWEPPKFDFFFLKQQNKSIQKIQTTLKASNKNRKKLKRLKIKSRKEEKNITHKTK